MKNLVVLCMFSDHTQGVDTRSQSDFDVLFNKVGGDPVLAPTGSVRDAYTENSYGIVTLESTVLAWVTLPQPMAYYAGANSGLPVPGSYPHNAQRMVEDALALVDPMVDFGQFDADNDGYIDAIDIIHSGYGAEQGGAPPGSIWSHKSALPADWVSADNNSQGVKVKVFDYHTEAALWGSSGNSITRIGVISHETGHFFGLPDLYDTSNPPGDYAEGIGSWCMMANDWGFDGSQHRPPHFSAWCKIFLGWIIPTSLSLQTRYTLQQSETSPSAYIATNGFAPGEYLLIENREPVGLDSDIPHGGLAVWQIDELKADNTDEGFPGQSGWPQNGKHYHVALLQADGSYDLERGVNKGDSGTSSIPEARIGLDQTPNPARTRIKAATCSQPQIFCLKLAAPVQR